MWDEEGKTGKSPDTLAGEIDALWFMLKGVIARMPPGDIRELVLWSEAVMEAAEDKARREDTDGARDYRDGVSRMCNALDTSMRDVLDEAGLTR